MKLIRRVLKTALVVSVLLLLGQVPIAGRTVGGHLAHNLYLAIVWVGSSLKEADWFAKMSDSQERSQRSSSQPPAPPTPPTATLDRPKDDRVAMLFKEELPVEKEKITSEDKQELLKLLDD